MTNPDESNKNFKMLMIAACAFSVMLSMYIVYTVTHVKPAKELLTEARIEAGKKIGETVRMLDLKVSRIDKNIACGTYYKSDDTPSKQWVFVYEDGEIVFGPHDDYSDESLWVFIKQTAAHRYRNVCM